MGNLQKPAIELGPIVLDCAVGQAEILSVFYSRLLGWEITHPAQNGTAAVTSLGGRVMAFQETETYAQPVWPWEAGQQGQMVHFDLVVTELDAAVKFAIDCGARLAPTQYFDDSRTLFDPAGHPFCLDTYHGAGGDPTV